MTFTATVTPNSGTFDNGGSVQFVIDGTNYGSPVSLSGGTATTSDAALGVGNHSVEAIYSGDTAFTGSNGSLNGGQQVNAVATLPVLTPPSPQTVSEGVSTPINMGSFTDSSAGPWTLIVTNWGDGGQTGFVDLSSTGTLPSVYHPYAEQGTYSVTITVTNTSDNLTSSPETFQVTVSDPSVNAIGGLSMQSVEGSSTGQQMVASFSDPGGSESLGDYSASINWGDNSAASTGTVSSLIGSVNVNIYSGHADTGSGRTVFRPGRFVHKPGHPVRQPAPATTGTRSIRAPLALTSPAPSTRRPPAPIPSTSVPTMAASYSSTATR